LDYDKRRKKKWVTRKRKTPTGKRPLREDAAMGSQAVTSRGGLDHAKNKVEGGEVLFVHGVFDVGNLVGDPHCTSLWKCAPVARWGGVLGAIPSNKTKKRKHIDIPRRMGFLTPGGRAARDYRSQGCRQIRKPKGVEG